MGIRRFTRYLMVLAGSIVLLSLLEMPGSVGDRARPEETVHEVIIVLAVALSLVLAAVGLRNFWTHGYMPSLAVATALLAFAAVYVWHGIHTTDAPAFAFLIYGPAARLAFWVGLAFLLTDRWVEHKRAGWVASVVGISAALALAGGFAHPWIASWATTASAAGMRSVRMTVEGLNLALGIVVLIRYARPRWHNFQLYEAWTATALALLSVQSLYFMLTGAWTVTWWLAHAVGAASTALLAVAVILYINQRRVQVEMTRLRHLNEMKTRFINTAAHELGTPLTPIRLQLALMQADQASLPEIHRHRLTVIRRNLDRLLELVDKILEGAKTEAGQIAIDPRPTDLTDLLKDAVDSYQAWCDEQGLALHLESPPELTVVADPRRVQQIISNFLSNAIKHTPSGGSIRISVEPSKDQVAIHVTDSGRGLSPHQQTDLFQPFAQLGGPDAPEGTGLGLYISRQLANRMGGHVAVHSEGLGKGSRFTFRLPLDAQASKLSALTRRAR